MCHPQQQTRDKLYYWSCCRTFLGCTTAEPPWYSGLPTVSPVTHWITALLSYVPGFYGMVAPCLAFLGFHCTMAPLPCVSGVSLYHGPTALRFWGFTVSWSHCLAFWGFHCPAAVCLKEIPVSMLNNFLLSFIIFWRFDFRKGQNVKCRKRVWFFN